MQKRKAHKIPLRLRIHEWFYSSYAASVGARHYVTSAKANVGIEDLFLDLTNQMVEVRERKLAATERTNSLRRGGGALRLEGEEDDHEEIPGMGSTTGDEARSSRCCH